MTNITETVVYEPTIYQLATEDPLQGGQAAFSSGAVTYGYLNASVQQLANRTAYLKEKVDLSDSELDLKAPLNSPTFTGTVSGITKQMVGLPNVDNTSDVNKPISSSVQSALNLKANLSSPTFTGVPLAPTAAQDTSTTQVATTAFVLGQTGSTLPIINGSANAGSSSRFSRQDHIHPTDTTRASLSSPTFTGVPAGPTPVVGTNTTQFATSAMVQAEIANKRSWTTFTPTVTATTNSYTSVSATGRYLSIFGMCHVQIEVTITTKGTGTLPQITLPLPAASLSVGHTLSVYERGSLNKLGLARILSTLTATQAIDYVGGDIGVADGNILYINGHYPLA